MKVAAEKNKRMEYDKSGFFVILVDKDRGVIVAEHYVNFEDGKMLPTGRLDRIVEGANAEEICHTIIREKLVSTLDHAAYLGMELQKAEEALKGGRDYEQS